MRGKRIWFVALLSLTVIISLSALLPNILIGNLVDHVLYEDTALTLVERILGITADMGTAEMLIRYVLGVVFISVFSTGLRYFVHYFLHRIGAETGARVRLALYKKLQTLSAGFFCPHSQRRADRQSDLGRTPRRRYDLQPIL